MQILHIPENKFSLFRRKWCRSCNRLCQIGVRGANICQMYFLADWLVYPAHNTHTAIYCQSYQPFSLSYVIAGNISPFLLGYVATVAAPPTLNKTVCNHMLSDLFPPHPNVCATSAGTVKCDSVLHGWGWKHKSDFASLVHVSLWCTDRSPCNVITNSLVTWVASMY
jgi:hypothetical protein